LGRKPGLGRAAGKDEATKTRPASKTPRRAAPRSAAKVQNSLAKPSAKQKRPTRVRYADERVPRRVPKHRRHHAAGDAVQRGHVADVEAGAAADGAAHQGRHHFDQGLIWWLRGKSGV
jgi:hypothetical protein